MISKSEYEGNIPYEEYVRRFKTEKRIQDKLLKQTEEFTKKTDTDIDSTQKAKWYFISKSNQTKFRYITCRSSAESKI